MRDRIFSLSLLGTALLALCTLPSPTLAQVTFAQFAPTARLLSFTNNGGTSGTLSASSQVQFNFTAASGLPTANHTATIAFNPGPHTFTPSSLIAGTLHQPISNLSTLSITEVGTGKNLLTLTFTGDLSGPSGGTTGNISGSDLSGNVVTYISDFLTFTPPGNSFNLSLSNISPSLSIGPGGFLNSFISDASGSFNATVTPRGSNVPEPGSVAFLTGLGITGSLFAIRRLRRRK